MKNQLFAYALVSFAIFTSCRDLEDQTPEFDNGTNEYINNWIYDELNLYYYWETDLPEKNITASNPDDFFYGLLSNQDRFSWIQPNFIELINSLQGVSKEAGYELVLYNDPEVPNGVLGQIAYVKKGSPAEQEGIKRGDIFSHINGSALTLNNYQELLRSIGETHELKVKRYNIETEEFEDIGDFTMNTIQFAENPNYLDTVYVRNGKNIGYFVYNLFSTGPESGNNSYNEEMDAVFERFNARNIDHLVLDLRYNSGGAETATINLASLIGSNISDEDIFVKRDYNEGLKKAIIDEYGADFLNKTFTDKAANIGNKLTSPQLTVLTSSRSASASELLINGLKPFMEIFIIGDTTVGKNVGSFSIYEEDNPENTWGMQPIVTKSFNSLNQSDYDLGFYPDIPLRDNSLIKTQLGDVEEKLLREALIYLAGSDEIARSKELPEINANDIMSSIEQKRRFGVYNIDIDQLD